jgi:hypothetical protein
VRRQHLIGSQFTARVNLQVDAIPGRTLSPVRLLLGRQGIISRFYIAILICHFNWGWFDHLAVHGRFLTGEQELPSRSGDDANGRTQSTGHRGSMQQRILPSLTIHEGSQVTNNTPPVIIITSLHPILFPPLWIESADTLGPFRPSSGTWTRTSRKRWPSSWKTLDWMTAVTKDCLLPSQVIAQLLILV